MSVYAERRKKLLNMLPDRTLAVIPGGRIADRNSDVTYPFRQDSNFQYLTGFPEPDAILLLVKTDDEVLSILGVQPRNPEQEVWTGRRAGPEGAVADYGMDHAVEIDSWTEALTKYLTNVDHIAYELGRNTSMDETLIGVIRRHWTRPRLHRSGPDVWLDLASFLSELRLFKDEKDHMLLRSAADAAVKGHVLGMQSVKPGLYEYQLQGAIEFGFRSHGGAGNAYNSIVAGGANATVLHYDTNREKLCSGDLVLVDAGCEVECMASDITRTYPIHGKFSGPQRDLYNLVLEAQQEALDLVKPGATLELLHSRVIEVLSQGLLDLGFFESTLQDVIHGGDFRRYYMHRTSHWLGLDVHDVGSYAVGPDPRPFEPDMVFTVEPGLYVAENDEHAPEAFRGIGIRIEDDILVTADGHENLTSSCPKTCEDIEATMQEAGLEMPVLS
ncbi:MAG: Xaa-Pro aminopeptidase [Myxococcales bacterium]|nr:Xaa-Pro aminopeptidase [Myxococcales bacterium]